MGKEWEEARITGTICKEAATLGPIPKGISLHHHFIFKNLTGIRD